MTHDEILHKLMVHPCPKTINLFVQLFGDVTHEGVPVSQLLAHSEENGRLLGLWKYLVHHAPGIKSAHAYTVGSFLLTYLLKNGGMPTDALQNVLQIRASILNNFMQAAFLESRIAETEHAIPDALEKWSTLDHETFYWAAMVFYARGLLRQFRFGEARSHLLAIPSRFHATTEYDLACKALRTFENQRFQVEASLSNEEKAQIIWDDTIPKLWQGLNQYRGVSPNQHLDTEHDDAYLEDLLNKMMALKDEDIPYRRKLEQFSTLQRELHLRWERMTRIENHGSFRFCQLNMLQT